MNESKNCGICGTHGIHPQADYCKRCKNLINRARRKKINRNASVKALKNAWDGKGFRCHYSGIRLIEDNSEDTRYLTFDHRTPQQDDDIVVAAQLINDMKSDMTEEEFKNMIIQLANHFKGVLDESVFSLKFWKRHSRNVPIKHS